MTRSFGFRTFLALEYGKSTNASAAPTMFPIVFPVGLDVKKCFSRSNLVADGCNVDFQSSSICLMKAFIEILLIVVLGVLSFPVVVHSVVDALSTHKPQANKRKC